MCKTQWTSTQVEFLVSSYANNTPIAKIAEALQKTPKAVERKASRLGITSKNRRDKISSARLKKAHTEDTKFRKAFKASVTRRKKTAVPEAFKALDRKLARCGIPADERAKIIEHEQRLSENENFQ